MLRALIPGLVLLIAAAESLHAEEGRLRAAQQQVRAKDPGKARAPSSNTHDDDDDDDDEGLLCAIFGLFSSRSDDERSAAVPRDPHRTADPELLEGWFADHLRRSAWVSLDGGYDFDHVTRVTARWVQDSSTWPLGWDSTWTWLHEDLANGSDDAVVGDLDAVVRFAPIPMVQLRLGAGLGLFHRDGTTDIGFDGLLGTEIRLAGHWRLNAIARLGTLGETSTAAARFTIGRRFEHLEPYLGYDWLRIGDVDFHGPMAGVRVRF